MTTAEKKIWAALRGRQIRGLKFRRQHPLGLYIIDFFCTQLRLVIKIDGAIHDFQRHADILRTEELVENGYKVIRFSNQDAENNLEDVKEKIRNIYTD